jgi:hypothetical protein
MDDRFAEGDRASMAPAAAIVMGPTEECVLVAAENLG